MVRTYTSNQTGAIATLLASVIWGLTAHGVGLMLDQTHSIYAVLIAIGWILLPFYVKLVRRAFIVGIYVWIIALCYLAITPSLLRTTLWYAFTEPLYHFTFVVFYLISLVGIYFSYKSYKELK